MESTPSDTSFIPTFEAGVAAADDDPSGVQIPTQQQQDFASTVLASDDLSAFTAPVVDTGNDDNFGQISAGGQDAGDGMVWTAMTDTSGNTVTDGFGNPVLTRTAAPKDDGGGGNDDAYM